MAKKKADETASKKTPQRKPASKSEKKSTGKQPAPARAKKTGKAISKKPKKAEQKITGGKTLSNEEIARRAYEIWESQGRPEGGHLEHWLQAEEELRRETGL